MKMLPLTIFKSKGLNLYKKRMSWGFKKVTLTFVGWVQLHKIGTRDRRLKGPSFALKTYA